MAAGGFADDLDPSVPIRNPSLAAAEQRVVVDDHQPSLEHRGTLLRHGSAWSVRPVPRTRANAAKTTFILYLIRRMQGRKRRDGDPGWHQLMVL
ncbi:MAG: hypothetical protein AVDCRST_MAG73-3567 [uncultured Thermomicrobiales bacterium]|uniref:Uncharacterized protein n=1 Tax=uncultured Thermomicrobiales bacterium TaxID=1645740 RepID=A0A6J4UU99_9BACT|nr:MAG: hypothetical protein AVDCRST_MAG73-3567 [uncultured Thermomicrobiales bacterium]